MISIISTEFLTLRLSSIYSSRRVVTPNGCEQGMTESAFFQQSAEAEPDSATKKLDLGPITEAEVVIPWL